VGNAQLVKDVGVSGGQFGNKHLGGIDSTPYLVDDFAGAEYIRIGPHRLQLSFLDGRSENLFVVVAVGRRKGLHHKAGFPGFDGNFCSQFLNAI
jgi:hypothetical protein